MPLVIEQLKRLPTFKQKVEIVERKGIGHPDTICDSIANEISIELSRYYLKRFGQVMHHNIDKALLSAGQVENRFGGGIIKRPMRLILGDRATFFVGGERLPIEHLAISAAKRWFKKNLRFVDPEKHVEYQIELKQGSAALVDIFKRGEEILGANDTSAAVGYAPQTPLEKTVLEVERFLNSKSFKKRFPESGEDVKVMGLRTGNELQLTIAMAFVDRFIDCEETYFRRKEEVLQELEHFLAKASQFERKKIYLNNLDSRGRGIAGLYLSVLGTCADGADCGQVGRGNRANGLISLTRPAGSEAAAGKNANSHPGKIYSVLSFEIARQLHEHISGLDEVVVWLLSQIGRPIADPHAALVQIVAKQSLSSTEMERIKEIVAKAFEVGRMKRFIRDLTLGRYRVC